VKNNNPKTGNRANSSIKQDNVINNIQTGGQDLCPTTTSNGQPTLKQYRFIHTNTRENKEKMPRSPSPASSSRSSRAESEGSGAAQMPAAATFASRKRERGWEGQELEWNHQRRSGGGGGGNTTNNKSVSAAVDLGQFQNTVVGQGYQAKHVIRQPGIQGTTKGNVSATQEREKDKDLKAKSSSSSNTTSSKSRSNNNTVEHKKEHDKVSSSTTGTTSLQLLLQSSGLRQFRREIESILNS
jgi:hypothetical protein